MTKKNHQAAADPFAVREAEKYSNPIPSREFILALLKQHAEPMAFKHIQHALALEGEEHTIALERRLSAMCRDGQLVSNRKRQYGLPEKMNLVTGRVIGHRDGFGFVVPDDASPDLTLSARVMRSLFDGDRVIVRVMGLDYRGRREGSLVEVLERNTQQLVGRYCIDKDVRYLIPENKRIAHTILITHDRTQKAQNGQIVTVQLGEPPTQYRQATGEIIEVVGDQLGAGMEVEIAIRAHQLPVAWPAEVQAHIAHLTETVNPQDIKGRVDVRHLPLVTIDGSDAKDFDDAVYCEKQGKNYRLIVAIADVSHYVAIDDALDQEALRRGNSVYFPGHVIPMLPEVLSNGLCSLKPKVDRLCMVCDMTIGSNGSIKQADFYEAVMHSAARLTYEQANDMLVNQDPALQQQYAQALPSLQCLYQVFHILLAARNKRGAIDFETVETQIVFSDQRKIEKIIPRHRNDAHRLIEECMLAANESTAKFLLNSAIPILYRTHLGPKIEKLDNLRRFLGELGLSLGGKDKPKPKDYDVLLQSIKGRIDGHLIQTMLLRSLSQAVYTPDNQGHFGLAYEAYTHFTSPIRRYPDLLVHRAIKQVLKLSDQQGYPYDTAKMVHLGEHSSLTERRADDATRDATDSLKCQYLKDKVGQKFAGVITHVTGFGFFVELTDIYVEGLVHVSTLKNDYYQFDAATARLCGERTGQVFRLGDKTQVLVARVDIEQKKIDFELCEQGQGRHKTESPSRTKDANKTKQSTKKPNASPPVTTPKATKATKPAKAKSTTKAQKSPRRRSKSKPA